MTKKILIISIIIVMILGCIESGLQSKMNEVLKNDSRNAGIEVSVYTKGDTLIYDIRSIHQNKSMLDTFRVFLQFAEKMRSEKFKDVILSYKGNTKFKIDGDYFQKLGDEYSWQNPVYTIRTFPENLMNIDGSNAYKKWTGGLLGVLKNQMEDFADFHKKWYIEDMIKNGELRDKDIMDMIKDLNNKIEDIDISTDKSIYSPTPIPTKIQTTTSIIYNIGDVASDGVTNIVVNGVRYTKTISENRNIITARQENKYVILDITLEIIKIGENRNYPQGSSFSIRNSDGYAYTNRRAEHEALRTPLSSAQTLVYGDKIRGELAFEIPENSKGLIFRFKINPTETISFKIKDEPIVQVTQVPPINKVVIEHSTTNVDKLVKYAGEYQYPSPGMTFLVMNLKIINQGYSSIKINKYQWSLKVSTKDNPNSYVETDMSLYSEEGGIKCKETILENGGWALCKISFEVPNNYDAYKIFWSNSDNVNIEWIYVH